LLDGQVTESFKPEPIPTVRELPPEEWDRLLVFEPFNSKGLPSPERTRILVVENPAREIVGWWFLFAALHAEPLWLREDYRKAGTTRRMIRGMQKLLVEVGAGSAFALIAENDLGHLPPIAARLGFERLPGALFWLHPTPTAGPKEK